MGYSASSAPILDSGYHFWDSDLLCRFHFHSVLQSGNLRDFLTIPILRASSFDSNQGICAIFLQFLSSELHLSIPVSFTAKTILCAIFLGIVVPVVTVLPVIYQLFQEIERSVHSDGNQVIEYEIHTAKEKPLISYFITTICLLVVVCGIAIYYFLPLGFISNDMTVDILFLIHSSVDRFLCVYAYSHPIYRGTGSPRSSSSSSFLTHHPIYPWRVLLQRNSHLFVSFDTEQPHTNSFHSARDSLRLLPDSFHFNHCSVPNFPPFHQSQILLRFCH